MATSPRRLGWKGWRDALLRTKEQIGKDNLGVVAAGVAFFAFLAVFPAIAAGVSIYALIADPAQVQQHFEAIGTVLPAEARTLLGDQLGRLASKSSSTLGLGVVIGLLVALWSANRGMKNLMKALSIAHDEEDERGFFKLNGLGLGLTLAGIILALVSLALVAGLPPLLTHLPLGAELETAARIARWPILGVVVIGALSVLYKLGPDRARPRLRWVTPGALVATLLWLVGSAAFSFYSSNFGSYNETYGSAAAFVVLLLWLQLSAFVILLGAELNAELEHQTLEDSTTGRAAPRGQREAYVADDLGRVP